jgi:hypothetical protein
MYWHCESKIPSEVRQIAWPFLLRFARQTADQETSMTQTYSKARQEAEAAFGLEQTEFFARGQAMEALDSIASERDAKTMRLREARKAKELADRLSATANTVRKRTTKA